MKNLWSTRDLSCLTDSLLILLICVTKNTQVSFFTYGHFQPTPFPHLSDALSLTLLICLSLSLSLSAYSPTLFSPVANSYKYSR
jgi:hypothetical protein